MSDEIDKGEYVLLTTGSTEGVKKKNLYDVVGNLWELVQEITSSTYSFIRGGGFEISYLSAPVCTRSANDVTNTATYHGFRPVLYIK